MARLNRLLRSLDIPVDLLVVSTEKFNCRCGTPGNVYFEAANEGEVIYEAAGTGPAVARQGGPG